VSKIFLAAFMFFSIACNKPYLKPTHPPSALLSAENGYNKDALLAELSKASNNKNKNHKIDVIFLNHDDFWEKSKNLKTFYGSKSNLERAIVTKINSIINCNEIKCNKLCGYTIIINDIDLKQSLETIFPVDASSLEAPNLDRDNTSTMIEIVSKVKIKFSIKINENTIFSGSSTFSSKGNNNRTKNDHPDVIALKNSLREILGFLRSIA